IAGIIINEKLIICNTNFKSATVLPCSVSYAYFVANHSEPKNKMRKAIIPVINIKMLLNRNILTPTSYYSTLLYLDTILDTASGIPTVDIAIKIVYGLYA